MQTPRHDQDSALRDVFKKLLQEGFQFDEDTASDLLGKVEEIHAVKTPNAFIMRVQSVAVKSKIFANKKNLQNYKQGCEKYVSVADNLTDKQVQAHKACMDVKYKIQDKYGGRNNVFVKKVRGKYSVIIKSAVGSDKIYPYPEGISQLLA